MDGVWRLNAPQWTDFASSPKPEDDDGYFDHEHEELEVKPLIRDHMTLPDTPMTKKLVESNVEDQSKVPAQDDAELDDELLTVKMQPLKVISPPVKKKNHIIIKETTYDSVLSEAMASLKLSTKKKSRRSTNIESTPSKLGATPLTKHKLSSRSLSYNSTPSNPIPMWIRKTQPVGKVETEIPRIVQPSIEEELKTDLPSDKQPTKNEEGNKIIENKTNALSEMCDKLIELIPDSEEYLEDQENLNRINDHIPNSAVDELPAENVESIKSGSSSRRASNISKRSSYSRKTSRATYITSQLRRRSITQYRRRSNKYISMAEAISKFQNATPERFRTTSNQSMKHKSLQRVRQSCATVTVPISPALRSKLRARAKNVLSHDERETQELKEIRKNPIKANPVRFSNSKASVSSSKKLPAAPDRTHVSESKSSDDPKPKILVPSVVSTVDGIAVTGAEILNFGIPDVTLTRTSATKTLPFSFEMRNKDLQRRREQKIKDLITEEEKKIKVPFHARPVPNFKKPVLPTTRAPTAFKPKTKPCPFSFEDRNKNLVKKKEDLRQAVMEEDKKARTFHAKPVPEFKPVLVRGTSRENLSIKSKSTNPPKGRISMLPVSKTGSRNCLLTNKTVSNQENENPVSSNTSELPQQKSNQLVDSQQESKQKPTNVLQEFHLNTDKRAKDRKEFDAKMRQKEQEAELLRKKVNLEKLAREEAEKMEIRKKAEIKARPMPTYKPPVVIHSDKILTVPQSPGWAKKSGH